VIVDTIRQSFREAISGQVDILAEGVDRYRVLTPFVFDDGDHLAIVLRQEGDGWVLSDEGHTYMHLTYDLEEKDLYQGTRQRIIGEALTAFSLNDREGELTLCVPEERFGDALFSFAQALLKIAGVTYLSRERVRSTFLDDFRGFLEELVPEPRRTFEWHDPTRDPEGLYSVDCRVNGGELPLFVYALPADTKVRDATIALHTFEQWKLSFRVLGVFENQEEVSRKVLARFTDVCDRQFSRLDANRDRIAAHLREALSS
jgi:hypothetical protein